MARPRLLPDLLARLSVALVLTWVTVPLPAFAQMEAMRFELGRRLTRFEKSWQDATPIQRAACVDSMENAVKSFFGLQLDTASLWLDRATHDVRTGTSATSTPWLAANRCLIDFEKPWIDADTRTLRFQVRRSPGFSDGKANVSEISPRTPSLGNLVLTLMDGTRPLATHAWNEIVPLSDSIPRPSSIDVSDAESRSTDASWHEWPLPTLPADDYRVLASVTTGEGDVDLIAEGVSISRNLDARMSSVAAWYEENRRNKGDTASATARWLARELKQGERGAPTEIDVPWNAWLQDFESLRDRGTDFLRAMKDDAPRTYWLQLSDGGKTQIVRLGLPSLSAEAVPVLFAFHGAGGSENMFFEAYGAGRLVELAHQRGWIVVSPRQSMTGLGMDIESMLDTLEAWLPIDRDRVLVVGHSMGAAQAIAQVSAHPDQVHAVAALGGGGMPRSSLQSSPVRFFVGAGDRDFGRPRAKSLSDALHRLDCRVEYREYPAVEHMVIVQAALQDVFEFLDSPGP